MMQSYITLDGRVLDLSGLTEPEQAFLAAIRAAYERDDDWLEVTNRVTSAENPVLTATAGRITRAAWERPLFQAVQDLADRVGVRQGAIAAVGSDVPDPFGDAWIPASDAATRKGVTRGAIHAAIRHGDLLARPARPGSNRLVVSVGSLGQWTPSPRRQRAGRDNYARRHARHDGQRRVAHVSLTGSAARNLIGIAEILARAAAW
jgi:hypothetical protein